MWMRIRGFTLIELMVTVAVVAILAAVAFPSYQDSLRKSRRTDGKNALTQAVANMERYYVEKNSYATAVMCAPVANQSICSGSCSGVGGTCTSTERNYTIAFAAGFPTATTFTLVAMPVAGGSQVLDGMLAINETNAKQQDVNHNGVFEATENVWK